MEELEQEQKKEIKEAIKDNRLYDYIVSNYWRIEDSILNSLLFECIATLKEDQNNELIKNLEEYRDF